jgi:hypothetical protein
LDPVSKFPETTGRPEYFVGFTFGITDALTFKILKSDLATSLKWNVVKSATVACP